MDVTHSIADAPAAQIKKTATGDGARASTAGEPKTAMAATAPAP